MCVTCQGKEAKLSSALLEEGCVQNPNPIESKVAKLMHIHACLGKLHRKIPNTLSIVTIDALPKNCGFF